MDQDSNRLCIACSQLLPVSSYRVRVDKKSGNPYYARRCNPCTRAKYNKTPSKEEVAGIRLSYEQKGVHTCTKCKVTSSTSNFSYYSSGKRAGHIGPCKPCRAELIRNWNKKNRPKVNGYKMKNYYTHWDKHKYMREREHVKSRARDRKTCWLKENPDINRANSSARRALQRNAVPSWVDSRAVQLIYSKAIEMSGLLNVRLTVDHVVPIKSPYVCGLHVQDNLQLLSFSDNAAKGNRFWPDMPEITPELKKMAKDFHAKANPK